MDHSEDRPQELDAWLRNFTLRDEANALVASAFRNGPIEDLHAGKHSALLEVDSLSRITDDEMKAIMLAACRQLAKLLELKESDPVAYYDKIVRHGWSYCREWER
ncbi:MAG: hypothetical protein AAF333_09530 [Planctomycetota bacterium]